MKWVLYILAGLGGLLVLAVATLIALGSRSSAGRFETTVEIAQPAPVVFEWISEPARLKAWVGWLIDVQQVTPGTGVGSREVWVMEDRNNNNQRMDIATEITKHEPDRVLEARVSAAEGFTGEVRYELESADSSKTRLTYTANYKFDHWLAKLLEPVISRSAQQKLEEDLKRLKQQVEAS
jgi:uncharacterized protein YndB with AHSA1/START domain